MPLDLLVPDLLLPAHAPPAARCTRLRSVERWLSRADLARHPARSAAAWLFDVHGRRVATLLDQSSFEAGDHRMPVAGLDALGKSLPSGIYFVRLVTEHDGAEARTVTILK